MQREHSRMVKRLAASGRLTPRWRGPVEAVPRHLFVPDVVWDTDDDKVDRHADPDRWMRLAYEDVALVTQVDEGAGFGDGEYTSSISEPSAVVDMLAHLDLEPGMRVLEVGTGTGWNAALLAHYTGDLNVTTIEIDPDLAARARRVLVVAGYPINVITGNGSRGWPRRAPYERIMSTASCWRVPYAWVTQTRPGGRILTPWGNGYANASQLRLDVHGDGTATGRVVGEAAFMRLRDQRLPVVDIDTLLRRAQARDVHKERIDFESMLAYPADLAVSLRLPDVWQRVEAGPRPTDWVMWLGDKAGSWAEVTYEDDDTFRVVQAGDRRLWSEVRDAYEWWLGQGSPAPSSWGVTVTPTGQTVWLRDPDHPVAAG